MIYDMILYIFNCSWIDTRWEIVQSHLHTNTAQNIENGTQKTIKKLGTYIPIKKFKINLRSAGRAPSLRVIPWHLPYNLGKRMEKPQLG
jgi:hypothetical protein